MTILQILILAGIFACGYMVGAVVTRQYFDGLMRFALVETIKTVDEAPTACDIPEEYKNIAGKAIGDAINDYSKNHPQT